MESADNDYLFRLQAGINDIETRIAQLRRSMNESNSQPASAPKASFQHFPSPQMNNVWNTQDVFFAASPLKSSSAHTPGGFRSPSRAASQGAPTINESLGQFVEWAQHTISNLQNERLQAQTRIVELEQLSQKQQQVSNNDLVNWADPEGHRDCDRETRKSAICRAPGRCRC